MTCSAGDGSPCPTVPWLAEKYAALGVPFHSRGDLLDEHLNAWATLWRDTPASHAGKHYPFRDVYFEPKAFSESGPALWLGGPGMHRRMTERIVRYGDDFNPLGSPTGNQRLRAAMLAAGRAPASPATRRRHARGVPGRHQHRRPRSGAGHDPAPGRGGFTTFCIKLS